MLNVFQLSKLCPIAAFFSSVNKTMSACVIIPCYNHIKELPKILAALSLSLSVFVIDDGSDIPVKLENPNVKILRLKKNSGKAEALKAGFKLAQENGFTHAITMDSDGQHPPKFVPKFLEKLKENPEAIIVGVRDFEASEIPPARKFMNKFSNFWFKAETGIALGDTQCGFRAYPLHKISELKLNFGGFVFEVELLVKAAWAGIKICEIQIPAIYTESSNEGSHYRPFVDTVKFSLMNTRLFFASVFFPKKILKKLALKK